MKTKVWFISLIVVVFISGCKLQDGEDESVLEPEITNKTVTLSGQVINHVTSEAIAYAAVSLLNTSTVNSTITESDGFYSFELEVETTVSISVVASKEGFSPDTVTINIAPGKTVVVPTLKLKQSTNGGPVISDEAASIYLLSQSEDKLGIIESGDVATALATFQVVDSSGIPIDERRVVEVRFSITAGPGGGEFLYPSTIQTNEFGQATVAITTGNIAGVVQVLAEVVSESKVIRSKPVFFTIYGGFAVQEKFAVASDKLNYPYWGILNKEIEFIAVLGDKYSNPVRPNTAVYFNTTEGIIGDFVYTDILGRATATLVTFGNPVHPNYGAGFFEVNAWTVTENSETISTNTFRLLSSSPIISNVSPTSFNISNGGSATFSFTVKDFNGNPVSSDHTITFSTAGGLTVSPDEIKIPDALSTGPGITDFTFTIGDSDIEIFEPSATAVTIKVNGPFGTFSYNISGTTE